MRDDNGTSSSSSSSSSLDDVGLVDEAGVDGDDRITPCLSLLGAKH